MRSYVSSIVKVFTLGLVVLWAGEVLPKWYIGQTLYNPFTLRLSGIDDVKFPLFPHNEMKMLPLSLSVSKHVCVITACNNLILDLNLKSLRTNFVLMLIRMERPEANRENCWISLSL